MKISCVKNRIISAVLCVSIIFSALPLTAYAEEKDNNIEIENSANDENLLDGAEVSTSNVRTVNDVISQIKFANKGKANLYGSRRNGKRNCS